MFDFLKQNRVLALAFAGTAVFLLCLVIWLAGMLGDDGTAPTPVAGAVQSGETSPAATPESRGAALNPATVGGNTGQAARSPTATRDNEERRMPAGVPACAPQCPGPWDSKDFYDDFPEAAPESRVGGP